jgi:hypothetical protein
MADPAKYGQCPIAAASDLIIAEPAALEVRVVHVC